METILSILPSLSKICERFIYNQINQMTDIALSIFQWDFRNKYSTQHPLITLIEKTRDIIAKGGTFGALLRYLSKAFDCMTRDFLKVKLHALNFDMKALILTFSYLRGREQRVKIKSIFSSYLHIFHFKVSRKDQF